MKYLSPAPKFLKMYWGNKDEYWKKYDALAARFVENFKLFADGTAEEVKKAGPVRLKA